MALSRPPIAPSPGPKQIPMLHIRHPDYDEPNKLLTIPALDDGAVSYNKALIWCGIIAGSSWTTGCFARAKDGSNKCELGKPLAASDGDVFYFAEENNTKYAVYISFDDWRLPAELPSAFMNATIESPPLSLLNGGYKDDVKGRDKSCRLSGRYDGCEAAHLVPDSERKWWAVGMSGKDFEIVSAQNMIFLRADLHRSFDSGSWIPMVDENGHIIACVIRTTDISNQFAEEWHNMQMQPLIGVDRQCLFARIAWSVLSLHYDFLNSRQWGTAKVLAYTKDNKKCEMDPKFFKQFSRSRSQNPSPRKRPLPGEWPTDGTAFSLEGCDDADSECDLQTEPNREEQRGRKRTRESSPLSEANKRRVLAQKSQACWNKRMTTPSSKGPLLRA